jgi:hypothetical protein
MKTRLLRLIACMALFTGVGVAKADNIIEFSATGTFSSNGWTLTGTMEVDTSAGCIIGTAGCAGGGSGAPGSPSFTVFSSPGVVFPVAGETFVLGANPGPPCLWHYHTSAHRFALFWSLRRCIDDLSL